MTIQALSDHRVLHGHPRRAGDAVTGGTVLNEGAVSRVSRGRSAAVVLVSEAEIAGAWSDSRLPRNSWLHHSIMTRRATGRVGPDSASRLRHARVTRDAQREQVGVFFVGEGVSRRANHLRRGDERTGAEHGNRDGRTRAGSQAH